MEVDINLIKPSPYQPRLYFDIEELKEEIKSYGLLSPLIVRKKDNYYELLDGERRLRALKELGWKKVPVEIREVDDEVARLIVYKLNMVRASYKTEELAKYFKKLHDEGMTFYQIAKACGIKNDQWVLAHLNVFKFPEEIQRDVWDGVITIAHIMELEPIIGAGLIDEAIKWLNQVKLQKLSAIELRKALRPRREELEKARIEAAREAIRTAVPISVKVETPEEIEKAAKALLKEAKKRKLEGLTPEERAKLEEEKKAKRERIEKARQKLAEKIRKEVEREAEKKAKQLIEAEKHRIEEEARKKVLEEIKRQPELIRAIERRDFRETEVPVKALFKEIVTEDVWECPICHTKCKLIHIEPRGHRLEEA